MTNAEIAAVLARLRFYLELKGENPFKALAFQRAARTVERHPESLETLVAEERLTGIKGVGEGPVPRYPLGRNPVCPESR